MASLVPEHRLWALGLGSRGTQALVALRHVGSSQIRGEPVSPALGGWILTHCTTVEVQQLDLYR